MAFHSILCIVGARPQFIKHKAIVTAFEGCFQTFTLHTGQHFDVNMSDVFFRELELPEPDFHLEDVAGLKGHGEQTAAILVGVENVLTQLRPDAVLVYGDTNSTLAGALAAAKLQIPVFHVEAGLRSFNRTMPEEVNRVLVDHMCNLLFAPTATAVANLAQEGLSRGVHLVGDVMCDVLKMLVPRLQARPLQGDYVMATVHRPSNADDIERMLRILKALESSPFPVLFALHPRTRRFLERHDIALQSYSNITFVPPLGYLDSLAHQKYAKAVVTDSGGIQKEAYLLGCPCITLRNETEWLETLEGHCNILLGERFEEIPSLLSSPPKSEFRSLYGEGNSGKLIAGAISEYFETLS